MHAFESIRAPKDTDAFYARDCSHVPCLCRDRQMPVDMSRIQPTIDGVGAQMSRLRINRRRQVGDGESPTCFESGRRILRPVFAQIGGKLVVSDVLRPILAHVRSKYSNTQHPDPQLRTTSRQTQAKGPSHNHKSRNSSKPRVLFSLVHVSSFIFSADKIFWTGRLQNVCAF